MADIVVKGQRELYELLQTLPVKLERNIVRGALRAGARPIKDAAVARCPVGLPSSEGRKLYGLHEGSLRDSIRISTRVKGATVSASVKAGGKTRAGGDVWYAHLIEFTGAKAHTITAKGRKILSFGGLFFQSVKHPGMRARPFMRPALESQAQAAVVAAAEYMKQRLATREGLDTAHIMIEGDE